MMHDFSANNLIKKDEMLEKIETWKKLIQSEKLRDVLEDIQMNIRVRPDNKSNENIFKLLLHLYYTVNKYRTADNLNSETGKQIAELTKLLCSLLTSVPNDNKFVKVLFKVVHCLLSLNLYKDAADVCCYLQPGNLYNPQDDTMNLLIKVLSLWHTAAKNIYLVFTNESLNLENYNSLKSIIKFEIKMTQIAYKNYTNQLINAISKHLDKIISIDKENKYFDDFYKHMLEYLKKTQLYLDKDEKYVIYCHILRIICHVICRTIDVNNIGCTVKILNEFSSYFNILLAEDQECYQCFQQFQRFCTTFLVPIESLIHNSVKNMQDIVSCQLNIMEKYGKTECLKWNALFIGEIVERMFKYWEICIETDEHVLKQLLDTDILLETMNFFLHIDTNKFYIKQVSVECKWCLDKTLCTVKRDLYNSIIMKYKCVSLLCKYQVKNLPKKICVFARETLEQSVKWIICEVKESKCKRWMRLWNTCRTLIYNMSILSEHVYEESIRLYSFLCVSIFQFQKIESNAEDFENILPLALYNLSVLHYKNGMYKEAITPSALNALLTYNQSNTKAFLIWTTIKKNVSNKIAQLTILDCLKNDEDKIKNEIGFPIDISKYDLIKLCSHEAKSLLEKSIPFTNGVSAILDKLRKLKPSNCQYAHVIQLLGYYLLGFEHNSSILTYHEQIISDLKQDKSNSVALLCLEANLYFFTFVEKLHTMNKQTQVEMENTKFALYAPKLLELVETKSPNIVPAYTMINVKKASSLMLSLQECLKKWKQLFKYNIKEIVKNWEPTLVLRILITAGEYSRLYRYEECEIEAWTLAYRLASEINDYHAIIYVTGRCISLRQIDYDWITIAKQYAIKHKDSKDESITDTIAMFWISLADLYFECEKYDNAKQLLIEARNLPGISFFYSKSVYLLSLDVIIRNNNLYNMQHENYGSYIVESLFTSRCLNHDLLTEKWKNQADYLFSYDVLFTTTVNLSMRINSLLSFRGISPDLVLHLKSAQSLGAVLRVAELLKSLCYIDLSRTQLDDCEVKLQGLEHILGLETFQSSMNVEPIKQTSAYPVTPTKIVNDPIRDTSQHSASPVLGKRVFDLPKFTLHTKCNCYMCSNVSYQYLVFTATYIRAQLYALQNQVTIALDHFYGAFEIRQKLFKEEESVLPENWPDDEIGMKRFSWQTRFYIIDYIQLLIDFCYFLKTNVTSRKHSAFDIANLAIDICHKYKLEGHHVYMSAEELILDSNFQSILEFLDCSKFTVPQLHDIDVTRYASASIDSNICVTPSAQNHHPAKPLSIRRRRSPVALKIPKINIIWSDDEDDDTSSLPLTRKSTRKLDKTSSTRKSKFTGAKLATRKILEEDLSDDENSNVKDFVNLSDDDNLNMKDSASKKIKSEHDLNRDGDNAQKKSIKDIIIKVAPLVPDISETLMDLTGKSDVPATMENIDELIKKVESLKINSSKTPKRTNFRDKTKLTIADHNKNVNQALELLKNIAINEKADENIDPLTPTKIDKQIQDQKTPHSEKKFFKTGLLKKYESVKLNINNETYNIRTRSSLRRTKEKL